MSTTRNSANGKDGSNSHEAEPVQQSSDGLGATHLHGSGVDGGGQRGLEAAALRQRPRGKENGWDPFYRSLTEAEKAIGEYQQVIRAWVPAKGITFIVSQRGMGKTTVLVDQGLTIAHDIEHWYGFPVDPDYWVVYVCGESADSALTYMRAWYERRELDPASPTRFLFKDRIVDLKNRKDCEALVTYLKGFIRGRDKAVIYLDTWQRTISPASTLDDEVMQQAADNAEWMGKELSAAIVVAAHPPKGVQTKGPNLKAFTISGAGVLENISQALWFINPQNAKQPDKLHIKLECNRIKGVGEGSRILFERRVVPIAGLDTFGKQRTSVVLVQEQGKRMKPVVSTKTKASADLKALLANRPDLSQGEIGEALGWSRNKVRYHLGRL
jgi:hypothetical protein